MKLLFQLLAALLLWLFIACNNSTESEAKTADMAVAENNTPAASANYYGVADTTAPVPAAGNEEQSKQAGTTATAATIDWDKKIIKNASLTVEAKDHKTYNDFVHEQIKRTGGYIAEEEQHKSEYKIENIVTIKVPVDQFDNLVSALTATKDENVVSQKVTSQDVTGEVIDTRSRTEAKRQIRLRYLELLKQAKNMEEILKVQQEINNIQVEIEAGAGRVNYLTHAAAYSTIQLTFYEILNPSAQYVDKPGFGKRVLNALTNGMDWIGEMLIVVLTLWPLWLLAACIWWFFKRWKARPTTGNNRP
ncbi:DUF4349 domain-containing protein [Longitalea luteola]|uniref:DUF4349 domain-containing protein n=1 Tax=Longitalea luteola TaxID=2812563 RepID=UPI001A9682C5|nr:DUF4349 domain-containing protein [Longitalea luteola]